MKIVFWHFYTFRFRRGIETLILSLANSLVRKGVEVSIVTATPTFQPLIQPDSKVKIYTYPAIRYFSHLFIVPFFVTHFLRHSYDHVVTFFGDFGEGWAWRFLNVFQKIPLTLYLCYPYSSVPHRYRTFMRLRWDRKAKHVLADATWIAQEAEKLFQRKVAVVPVGTDPERFRPDPILRTELRNRWGITDQHLVLLNVSSLEKRKGTWRVIQAMGRLRNHFTHTRYFILGSGDHESALKKMVHDLALDGQVIFGGTTSRLEAYYNMADLFVMLPDEEGNSIACHEAMSCGLPVIVSNTEGFVESVPSQAGFLINPDKPSEVDSALTTLITDRSLRHRMGQAGRAHILQNCTWDKRADKFLESLS